MTKEINFTKIDAQLAAEIADAKLRNEFNNASFAVFIRSNTQLELDPATGCLLDASGNIIRGVQFPRKSTTQVADVDASALADLTNDPRITQIHSGTGGFFIRPT